jgi:hypothetical protein
MHSGTGRGVVQLVRVCAVIEALLPACRVRAGVRGSTGGMTRDSLAAEASKARDEGGGSLTDDGR